MSNFLKASFAVSVLVLAGVLYAQHRSIATLTAELEAMRAVSPITQAERSSKPRGTAAEQLRERFSPSPAIGTDPTIAPRLEVVEASIQELLQSSRLLMERGQLPLSPSMLEEVRRRFLDPAASAKDRLGALRLLGRNGSLNDETLLTAANWALSSTNSAITREILGQIGGSTNTVLRGPLMQLASTSTDPRVRAAAFEDLRRFAGDPQVSQLLWQTVATETDERVRLAAQDAIRRAPMTEARLAELQQHALNPQASPEERLTAVRAMMGSKADMTDVGASIAAQVNATQDPAAKAQLLRSLDDFTNPVVLPTLVGGLQDGDANVRLRSADALSGFASDATVQQWLRYIMQNDPDPMVKREAAMALGQGRDSNGQGKSSGGKGGGSDESRRGPRP